MTLFAIVLTLSAADLLFQMGLLFVYSLYALKSSTNFFCIFVVVSEFQSTEQSMLFSKLSSYFKFIFK